MKNFFVLGAALCVYGFSDRSSAEPCYDVEILWGPTCPIFGPSNVYPEEIAPDGTIVGNFEQCADPGIQEGFVWPAEADPFIIPQPEGAIGTPTAHAINGTGQIGVRVGISGNELGLFAHIYDIRTGDFTPIGVPPGGTSSEPHAINNLSHTCGEWSGIQAFVSTDRGLFDLSRLLTGPNSSAKDINDIGSIVGFMGGTVGPTHRGFLYRDGEVTDFGIAPGCINSTARAINQREEVAAGGAAPTPGGNYARPFLWVDGRWTSIDMLPGFLACQTTDLNDHTIVVGACGNPKDGGYVWVDGVTYDLNDRISPDSDVEIGFALAINNAGQIACQGKKQHPIYGLSTVGVRLTPRPPQPADFTDDCIVDGEDLMILLQSWGKLGKRNANPAADLDGNGVVNGFDLGILLGMWG